MVYSTMRPRGVTEEQIKLRAFPFSLADKAKDWLYYLPAGSIMTWNEMKRQFLKKNFPASRAINIRKEIYGISNLTERPFMNIGRDLNSYMQLSLTSNS